MILRRNLQSLIQLIAFSYLPLAICLPSTPSLVNFCSSTTGSEGMRLRGGGLPFPSKSNVGTPSKTSVMETKPTSITTLVQQFGIVVAMVLITVFSRPNTLTPVGESPSIQHVFHYGFVAALSTGLGALPLLFMGKVGCCRMLLAPEIYGLSLICSRNVKIQQSGQLAMSNHTNSRCHDLAMMVAALVLPKSEPSPKGRAVKFVSASLCLRTSVPEPFPHSFSTPFQADRIISVRRAATKCH